MALKPLWTQQRYQYDVRPLRLLEIATEGRLPEGELARCTRLALPPLPEGFVLRALGGRP